MVYLYIAEEHEYEEGFGPSVTVRIGNDETTWKRSRNKWNPFEKIKTVPGIDNSADFKVIWDRAHSNSFYVTERMYYYLDREKHRDKFRHLRAKLYITRLQQRAGQSFLLQFIIERAMEEGEASLPSSTSSSLVSSSPSIQGSYQAASTPNSAASSARSSRDYSSRSHRQWGRLSGSSNASGSTSPHSSSAHNGSEVPSPRTDALFSAFGNTQLNTSPSSQSHLGHQQQFGISGALVDHYSSLPFDSSRIQSFPPMFNAAQRFYQPGMVATPSNPQFDYATAAALASAAAGSSGVLLPQQLSLPPHHHLGTDEVANFQARLQLAQQMQFQQMLAHQAIEYQQQRDAMFLQQLREQAAMSRATGNQANANGATLGANMMNLSIAGANSLPTSPGSTSGQGAAGSVATSSTPAGGSSWMTGSPAVSPLATSPSSTTSGGGGAVGSGASSSSFSTSSFAQGAGVGAGAGGVGASHLTTPMPRFTSTAFRSPTVAAYPAPVPQHHKSRSLDPQLVNAWRSESGTIKRQHETYDYEDMPETASKRRSTEILNASAEMRHSYGPIVPSPGGSGTSTPVSALSVSGLSGFGGIDLATLAQEAENARANQQQLASENAASSADGSPSGVPLFKFSVASANPKRHAFAPSPSHLAAIAQEAAALESDGSSESLNVAPSVLEQLPSTDSAMAVDSS